MLRAMLDRHHIEGLSAAERLELIAALWDSMTDAETPFPETQREEIERRLASFEEDRAGAISWEQLKAELKPPRA
jgi:putative addiction module component (TIGR02574 family)